MTGAVRPAPWLVALLGPAVRAHEVRDASLVGEPWPDEEQHVSRAVPARRHEFAGGRACARAGLIALGREPRAIPVGAQRAPVWPSGVVGSISHSAGWCIAAVALAAAHAGIGVDIEMGAVPATVLPVVLTAAEREAAGRDPEPARRARVVFSAKESTYKAFAAVGASAVAGYEDVEVEVGPGWFRSRLVRRPTTPALVGRWTEQDGAVVTAVALRPHQEQP